jgi:hypothetical protein
VIDIKELEQLNDWNEFKEKLKVVLRQYGLNNHLIDDALFHLKPFVDVFASELTLDCSEISKHESDGRIEQDFNKELKSIVQDIKQRIDNDFSNLLLALIRLVNVIASK